MDTYNNEQTWKPILPKGASSIIKIIGVGGGGCNALKHMYKTGIEGVDFIICNTDAQSLNDNPISNKVQLGIATTEGLGAGGDPEVGEKAANESVEEIKASLGANTKMVFITTGMGGGTGTGAAPVIARVAKEMGILTVAIVTMPFDFEGKRRKTQAMDGLSKLKANVDSLIVINNNKVVEQFPDLDYEEAFLKADDILMNAVKGMAEVVSKTFYINVDFRDAKTVLQDSGTALMSIGVASGENRATEAVKKALESPLLDNNKIRGAKNVLVVIQAGVEHKPKINELNIIPEYIQTEAGGNNEANIIWGAGVDEELGEALKVLVIATGFSSEEKTIVLPEEEEDEPEVEKKQTRVVLTLDSDVPEQPKNVAPSTPQNEMATSVPKNETRAFRLDDDVMPTPTNFSQISQVEEVETMVMEDDEVQGFGFDKEEDSEDNSYFLVEEVEEEEPQYEAPNLFSYEEENEETVSFTFDFSDEEETPVFQKEEEDFEVKMQTPIQIEEEEEEIPTFTIREEVAPIVEEKEVEIENSKEEILEVEQQEEFRIVQKKTEENPKIMERRNKLKEFNSRYAVEDSNPFETIPAFKRRNIDIKLENASEQRITNYISEENGQTKIRENRFLNKDVD